MAGQAHGVAESAGGDACQDAAMQAQCCEAHHSIQRDKGIGVDDHSALDDCSWHTCVGLDGVAAEWAEWQWRYGL